MLETKRTLLGGVRSGIQRDKTCSSSVRAQELLLNQLLITIGVRSRNPAFIGQGNDNFTPI